MLHIYRKNGGKRPCGITSYVQGKPDNKELSLSCQLICKIIQAGRETIVPYFRDFPVYSVCMVTPSHPALSNFHVDGVGQAVP